MSGGQQQRVAIARAGIRNIPEQISERLVHVALWARQEQMVKKISVSPVRAIAPQFLAKVSWLLTEGWRNPCLANCGYLAGAKGFLGALLVHSSLQMG